MASQPKFNHSFISCQQQKLLSCFCYGSVSFPITFLCFIICSFWHGPWDVPSTQEIFYVKTCYSWTHWIHVPHNRRRKQIEHFHNCFTRHIYYNKINAIWTTVPTVGYVEDMTSQDFLLRVPQQAGKVLQTKLFHKLESLLSQMTDNYFTA